MLKYILLGILQGITEFLPISSSGHLFILINFFKMKEGLGYVISLHLGTLLALAIFFFKDIMKTLTDYKLLFKIILATFFTGLGVLILREFFYLFPFGVVKSIGICFIINGIILLFTKKAKEKKRYVSIKDAILFGVIQSIAVLPGISRSGITISSLLFRGLDRLEAFKFSFYAGIFAILGAAFLEMKSHGCIIVDTGLEARLSILGFICSFLTGILSLYFLKRTIAKAKFYLFGYYSIFLGVITLFLRR